MGWALRMSKTSVPIVRSDLDKKVLRYFTPLFWDDVQKDLQPSDLVTVEEFKSILNFVLFSLVCANCTLYMYRLRLLL